MADALRARLHGAVVISLARRPAKRESFMQRARAAGLSDDLLDVFDAVDGSTLSTDWLTEHGFALYPRWQIPGHTNRFYSRHLKWGEVGCAISHWRVWETIAARDDHRATLVFEDDVVFADGFAERLALALDELERLQKADSAHALDFFYLLHKPIGPARQAPTPLAALGGGCELVAGPPPSWKMAAYALFPAGARKLVASDFRTQLVPVDDFLPAIASHHPLRPDLDGLFHCGNSADGTQQARDKSDRQPSAVLDEGWLRVGALVPNVVSERRLSLSDTENSSEVEPTAGRSAASGLSPRLPA